VTDLQVACGTKIGFKVFDAERNIRPIGFLQGYEGIAKACAFEPQVSSASERFMEGRDAA